MIASYLGFITRGTALFVFLAMAGYVGGSIGPYLVGIITEHANDNLKAGLLAGSIFPAVLIISACLIKLSDRKNKK